MKIGVVGLGLLGGSIAKALSNAGHYVFGIDKDKITETEALACGAISDIGDVSQCEAVFVCIYPKDAVDFMLNANFKSGALVTDICGVKRYIFESVALELKKRNVCYIGSHPMAGKEQSGFEYSSADIFKNASYIITKDLHTNEAATKLLARLADEMSFARITYSTPEEHDNEIAYTSQLAHVVSNCYMKNPAAQKTGFSAGSFLDLTRVAKLNPRMWAELFLENSDFLCEDIDILIKELNNVKAAILAGDEERLRCLLKEGSDIKENLLKKI